MSEAWQAALERLRAGGAAQLDPAGWHALDALAARLPAQPEPVRRLLEARLQAGLAACEERLARAQQAARAEAERVVGEQPALAGKARRLQAALDVRGLRRLAALSRAQGANTPLAQLNESIRAARLARTGADGPGEAHEPEELASVRRFRRAWHSGRSVEQVEQALARKPAQAGPLNSHHLVLQALELMRELSPDYLRHFLAHVEALQWLEGARESARPARPARRGPRRK